MTHRTPYVIGVTGNIACGKSLVLSLLAKHGALTLDADRVYHSLIEPGRPLSTALVERFGQEILGPGGVIDRRALAAIVFSDPIALADLDALTHPAVIAEIELQLTTSAAPVIAIDAVKLFESGMDRLCDEVWLVTCQPQVQIQRLIDRNGLSHAEAARRIAAQPPLADKLLLAGQVIDNSGTRDETEQIVDRAWSRLPILPS